MTCDKCGKDYKAHELELIPQWRARLIYGFNDIRLGNYYICNTCKYKCATKRK
jgi:hypothetical protein